MGTRTLQELQMLQALPLAVKAEKTKLRIREWVDRYGEDGVYVSFSGGKDSTVLLHIARQMYPNLKSVFVDTGLEYPEIRAFVKTFDNVDWIKPKMNFRQVIEKYGYPFISKEVSESVDGARKYLKILTDRQTDRQFRMLNSTANFKEQENTKPKYQFEYNKLCGHGKYAPKIKGGGTTTSIVNSEDLENMPIRTAKILGMLTKDNKIKENIPEYDRSMYSQEKYKFFLDAPFNISSKCCSVMKKQPVHSYAKQTGRKPMTAQMADESRLRTQQWIKNGCNGFDMKSPISNPMSFWTEQDVLLYIKMNNIEIASVYGEVVKDYEAMGQVEGQLSFADLEMSSTQEIFELGKVILKTTGCSRTGCMFCGYGCHLEKSPNRFERMKETHPKQYDYIMRPTEQGGLNYKEIIDWINENGNMNIKY